MGKVIIADHTAQGLADGRCPVNANKTIIMNLKKRAKTKTQLFPIAN